MDGAPRACALLAMLSVASAERYASPTEYSDFEAMKYKPYLRRTTSCTPGSSAADDTLSPTPPAVLHQIWWQGEANLPSQFKPLRESWVKHHPSWTVKLWDEASATALVNKSYGWFAPIYHALPSKIQKADAARYVILHAEGGLYADLDIEAFQSLDRILQAEARPTTQLFEEPVPHWSAHDTVVSNGLLASPKGHPLLFRLLSAIRPVSEVRAFAPIDRVWECSSIALLLQATLERVLCLTASALVPCPSGPPALRPTASSPCPGLCLWRLTPTSS